MDIRRIGIALLVAFVLSAGASFFLYNKLRSQRSAQPATTKIVTASTSLEAGAALTSENLTTVDMPTNLVITGSFTKVDEVVGRSLLYPVVPKQPVLEHNLAMPGSGIGITRKIPPGYRGIAIRSNDVVGVAGFLYPGSHVDVLLTYRPEGSPDPVTRTVLQDVEVLTAGQKSEPDRQGRPETVSVVTLLLSPEDSEKITLAGSQGSIQFALRNSVEKHTPPPDPMDWKRVTGGGAPPVYRHAPPRIRPVDVYEVETIMGHQRTREKF